MINFTFNFPTLSYSRQFLERDYIIIDLKSGVEWLRCSTGQTWNGKECEGQIVRLNFEEIQEALKQANEQLGDGWRLPTKLFPLTKLQTSNENPIDLSVDWGDC